MGSGRVRFDVVVVFWWRSVVDVPCFTADDLHILKPKSLNGHYINWLAECPGTTVHQCQDTPLPPPPPDIKYVPNNMIFTRVQMAGDRAFVVCPRFRYKRLVLFSVSTYRDYSSKHSTDLEIFPLGFRFFPSWTFPELLVTIDTRLGIITTRLGIVKGCNEN